MGRIDRQFNEVIGPQISVLIGLDQASEKFRETAGLPVPSPIQAFALIDTGAIITNVDSAIIQELGLDPTDTIEVETGHSRGTTQTYDIRLVISNFDQTIPFDSIRVAAAKLEHKRHRVGRDVLQRFILTYNGPRKMFRLEW